MFKWHVNSALGRGRPVPHDLARVADGIAASLRQFSISAARYSEDGRDDALRTSRSSRALDARNEVSSLAPSPSRGIDARSLAASPPPTLVRRVDPGGNFPLRGSGRSGPGSISRGPRQDFAGRRGNLTRGGARPGMTGRGGRGGRGSRGKRGGRGRGKGKDGKRERDKRPKAEDDMEPTPYTAEEIEYIDHSQGGFQKPYTPVTSAQDLARWGPPVISSPRGVVETIANKMAVATDNQNPEFKSGELHVARIRNGVGTLFENAEERRKSRKAWGKVYSQSLSQQDQEAMMKQWAAGWYNAPQPVNAPDDVLAQVAAYMTRNETYLPADARKLEGKLRSLLPDSIVKPPPSTVQRPL
ncbi:hypothetical protein QTJ16_004869 [Diplocarpon rosae]|uniref:Uncharacterized protein n=1 Tax=Diplocarpon rosae TaxID=946125 RepID=A0AAD9SXW7_9HELO|nr:hypothetical protein QTJ16_004869 [Diplocarpon rosae]PBP21022.1 hypothetical protein BUE80_DR008195 [Diplocarpon rosae]